MKCTFCGNNISQGTGKVFVDKTSKVLGFCSSKCEKNLRKLHRLPRNFKWTVAGRKKKSGDEK